MKRRLVAALACRVGGSRLYGKPLQNLDAEGRLSILDHLITLLKSHAVIDDIVLGISEGEENTPFVEVATRWGLQHIWGDRIDVLKRLVQCGQAGQATDIFRVTTECPFIETSVLEEAWRRHVERGNDVTATDGVPEGTHFEIYTRAALETSHERGGTDERSERCSLYVRRHLDDFQVEIVDIPDRWKRLDLRLTVDYPEDLVVCRRVYAALRHKAPRIPLDEIIAFLDSHPETAALVAPYVSHKPIWARPEQVTHG
jgi:spore coat polysaccharide biosynthesis protein SpsF